MLADNDDDDDAGAAPDDWLMAANVALDAALGLNPPLKHWTTQELQSAINRRPETMVSALVVHRRRRAGCAALQAPGQADAMSRNWTPAASTAPLRDTQWAGFAFCTVRVSASCSHQSHVHLC